jgi:ceramide synthetase
MNIVLFTICFCLYRYILQLTNPILRHQCCAFFHLAVILTFYQLDIVFLNINSNFKYVFYTDEHIKFMYCIQFIHKIQSCVFQPKTYLSFSLYIHHICTLLLIISSWYSGYHVPGILIMFIHDVSDIFTYLLRIMKTLKLKTISLLLFMPFQLISWILFRLLSLPIITWLFYQSPFIESKIKYICIPFLFILFCLHICWFKMMIYKIYNALTGRDY